MNTIYRNTKTLEQFNKYINKSEKVIKRFIASWENLEIDFWNTEYRQIFYQTKEILNTFLVSGNDYELLENSLKIIIETQKAIYKMQEIRDYNITLFDVVIEKDNICVVVNTYNIIDFTLKKFKSLGYEVDSGILNAVNFGVPQNRQRYIIMGVKSKDLKKGKVQLPKPLLSSSEEFYTIKDAIEDLAQYKTSVNVDSIPIQKNIRKPEHLNPLQIFLNKGDLIFNHVTTNTRDVALERFKNLKQGQNFHNLNENLKTTYSDPKRTQNTIYLRLNYKSPSGTVLNVRKSMWIHPELDRAISIREAARLQAFPDDFIFCGPKDAQYQQIGNAVPPLLGQSIAEKLLELFDEEHKVKLSDVIAKNRVITTTK